MKRIWKRSLALLLALLAALSLAACGGRSAQVPPAENTAQVQTPPAETPSPSPTPADNTPADDAPAPTATEPSAQPAPDETAPPAEPDDPVETDSPAEEEPAVSEDGWYSSKEEVALYIHLYGHLPDNYITKREAEDLGWSGGSVERWAGEGKAIGDGRFGNYEGLLPTARGRTYAECDIDTVGTSSRGAKRIVFSNDGLIYYTEDHYASFELLYGEP